jgi:hypothetical protein
MEHINWLSWLQHTDYDVWLILMEYLEPIIHLRKSFPRIRRDPWFNEFIKNNGKTKLYFTLDKCEEYQPLSVYYNRYLNYKDRIIDMDECYDWRDLLGRKNTLACTNVILLITQKKIYLMLSELLAILKSQSLGRNVVC